jgi:CRP-like cAMP-binding protein
MAELAAAMATPGAAVLPAKGLPVAARRGFSAADWEVVRNVPLFRGLSHEVFTRLLAPAQIETAPMRAMLFLQGDRLTRLYVVIDGFVKLSRLTSDGEQAVIAVVARGDILAEAALFDGGFYPASAEVVAPARLLAIPTGPLLDVLRSDSGLAFNMLKAMSLRLKELMLQVEQLNARSAPQRLGSFLLPLLPRLDAPARVDLPYEKALIAARLGMKPETFSRALAKLRPVGVTAQGNTVTVARPADLLRFCEGG